jgi:hypothetical protein
LSFILGTNWSTVARKHQNYVGKVPRGYPRSLDAGISVLKIYNPSEKWTLWESPSPYGKN